MKEERSKVNINYGFWLLCAVLLLFITGRPLSVHAADRVYIPDRAVRSGNNVFWAIGNDGEGPLHCYNISTKKDKVLVNAGCKQLSIKGNYLYFTIDSYGGSDGANEAIYRVSTSGSGKKCLAKGHYPVLIGNYIYYIAVQKATRDGVSVNGKAIGIYRMNLDGSGKKCIYKGYVDKLVGAGSKLIFYQSGKWYSIGVNGGTVSRYTWGAGRQNCNTNLDKLGYSSSGITGNINRNNKNYVYSVSGSNLYRTSGTTKTKIATFSNETIRKVIDMNGYLFVITSTKTITYNNVTGTYARGYVVNQSGKILKRVYNQMEAGGSW
jgi:hypothetical protein